ncbi:hypothetical protein GCM10020220_027940 [Nonomuraea rubra]
MLIVLVLVRPQLVNQGSAAAAAAAAPPRGRKAASVRVCAARGHLAEPVVGGHGLHLWPLAIAMGAPPSRSLLLCVGAFTLATSIGIAAVFIPDGIGVREAVLTATLSVVPAHTRPRRWWPWPAGWSPPSARCCSARPRWRSPTYLIRRDRAEPREAPQPAASPGHGGG